ncbi:MAG TPA: hypothetical protein VMZ53_03815 [Kofleriaceae bacterium]|nr:hypothetical protein [Kofleriaceae bacterium]
MAVLTDEEKASIRMYMGWSARFAQTDTALERAMSAIDGMPADLALVRVHLTELARIDAAIQACEARFKADQVGSITLSQSELPRLRSRGMERVGRLATLLGVEVRDNAFSPDLPRWRGGHGGPSGGGNYQMQG